MAVQFASRYSLAPYFALALLLHAALLAILPPISARPPHHPPKQLHVMLSPRSITPPVIDAHSPPHRPSKPSASPNTGSQQRMTAPEIAAPAPNTPAIHSSQWQTSISQAAKQEAQRTTQLERQRAASPIGSLNAANIAKEEVLANGIRRITTSAGTTYCLQPPPLFARDQASLFNVPTTCP